jgi:acyl-CoA thioesterase
MRVHKDGVTIRCVVDDRTKNGSGGMHGGVLATMADAAMGIGLASHFGGRRPITTTDLKINYLRPVTDGAVTARSRIIRVGKHLCVGRVEIRDSERRLAAAALVTYIRL